MGIIGQNRNLIICIGDIILNSLIILSWAALLLKTYNGSKLPFVYIMCAVTMTSSASIIISAVLGI